VPKALFRKLEEFRGSVIHCYEIGEARGQNVIFTLVRESHQVGADTEARTLARRHADRGGEDVKHREHRRRRDGHRQDLVKGQGLPGDEHEREGHRHALHDILDYAR